MILFRRKVKLEKTKEYPCVDMKDNELVFYFNTEESNDEILKGNLVLAKELSIMLEYDNEVNISNRLKRDYLVKDFIIKSLHKNSVILKKYDLSHFLRKIDNLKVFFKETERRLSKEDENIVESICEFFKLYLKPYFHGVRFNICERPIDTVISDENLLKSINIPIFQEIIKLHKSIEHIIVLDIISKRENNKIFNFNEDNKIKYKFEIAIDYIDNIKFKDIYVLDTNFSLGDLLTKVENPKYPKAETYIDYAYQGANLLNSEDPYKAKSLWFCNEIDSNGNRIPYIKLNFYNEVLEYFCIDRDTTFSNIEEVKDFLLSKISNPDIILDNIVKYALSFSENIYSAREITGIYLKVQTKDILPKLLNKGTSIYQSYKNDLIYYFDLDETIQELINISDELQKAEGFFNIIVPISKLAILNKRITSISEKKYQLNKYLNPEYLCQLAAHLEYGEEINLTKDFSKEFGKISREFDKVNRKSVNEIEMLSDSNFTVDWN